MASRTVATLGLATVADMDLPPRPNRFEIDNVTGCRSSEIKVAPSPRRLAPCKIAPGHVAPASESRSTKLLYDATVSCSRTHLSPTDFHSPAAGTGAFGRFCRESRYAVRGSGA